MSGGKRGRRGSGRGPGIPVQPRNLRVAEPLPAGSDLGDLTPETTEVDITFGWFGQQVRISPTLSELELIDWAEKAMTIDEDSPEAAVAVKNQLRLFVHADDFDAFWDAARRHRAGIVHLMKLMYQLVEAAAGRPTGEPSGSSTGQDSTAPSSKDGSSSRVIRRLDEAGRPDLALAVVARSEAQAAG